MRLGEFEAAKALGGVAGNEDAIRRGDFQLKQCAVHTLTACRGFGQGSSGVMSALGLGAHSNFSHSVLRYAGSSREIGKSGG